MATVTQNVYIDGDPAAPNAKVDVEFDDTNGAISRLLYVVNNGALRVYVTNPPRPLIVQTLVAPTTGAFNLPASQGYSLTFVTLGSHSGWQWKGPLSIRFRWAKSVAELDATE